MGIRTEKLNESNRMNYLKIISYILSVILMVGAVFFWHLKYKNSEIYYLIEWLQRFYIIVNIIFIIISLAELTVLSIIFKNVFKLSFSVWLMAYILIKALNPLEQSIYIIYAAFLTGYLEVLFEIREKILAIINDINLSEYKIKYTKKDFIETLSTPFTVIIVATLHILFVFILEKGINTFPY